MKFFKKREKKSVIGYAVLSYVLAVVGALILAPVVGKLYSLASNDYCEGSLFGMDADPGCKSVGFLIGYLVLLVFFSTSFLKNNKIIFLGWLIGLFLIPLIILIMPLDGFIFLKAFTVGTYGFIVGFLALLFVIFSFIFTTWEILAISILGYFLGKLILKFKK